ncbi:serine/threonine protein kinase [Aliikangiella marina]|uniref:Serine/threonine protein kinase n=1 Tax=Aliikangiella marina TaxID=1712262 RepID=A0A545TH89_9GAMM|nr:serine/threonine-protein kinase [Aliikangiella marina]TQV76511.1 serine/threonine protein kinase [Aliikangiella marina]
MSNNNNKSSHPESEQYKSKSETLEETEITDSTEEALPAEDATVIAPEVGARRSARTNTENTSQKNYNELTRINLIFQDQHSEHGFRRAQNDVNEALSKKEILLNKRFVLDSVLGSGGMGTVYKAKDLRKVEAHDANPYVAVKVLNSDFKQHPNAFISLQREASRSHLLSHPNIVTVHDFDRDGNTIYMTMELLKGEALDSYLYRNRDKTINKEMALKIVGQFCRALQYAHQKGIVHCDLKPANIFISDNGVKVLDFGIARLASESKLTDQFDAGSLGAMTPAYASLEMMQQKKPEASDDVYAAAIITYKLLTGRHPYNEQPAVAALGLKMQPERIDGLTKRQWKALLKGLALKREERTQTIQEFYQELTEPVKFPVFRVASALLLGVVGWFVYKNYFVPDELAVFVETTKNNAQQCYQAKDYVCAITSANAILKVAPDDDEAKSVLANAERDLKLTEINELLMAANNCFLSNDYSCVETTLEQVLLLDSNNQSALALQQKMEAEKLAEAEAREQESKQLAELLSKANDCLERTDYQCAIEFASEVLVIKHDEAQAEAIIRNANYAEQKQRENFLKAEKILKDGQTCFEKLNYSCAIAKSESALEFVPGHRRALRLKSAAERAIADAKKNITIE